MGIRAKKFDQISVFLENRPGVVADLCTAFTDQEISIQAMTVLDTIDIGTMRLVVDKPEQAQEALQTAGAAYVLVPVLGLELPNKPGEFGVIARQFSNHDVNIEYVYATAIPGADRTFVVIRVPDTEVDRAITIEFDV